jgi:hypothetical protein
MSKCDAPGCTGHLGKFDDCRTEALYDLALDVSDWHGSTEWDISAAFLEFGEPESLPLSDGRTIAVPIGFYGVACNDQGFVWSIRYSTLAAMMDAQAEIDEAYGRWDCDECDPDGAECGHHATLSSNGRMTDALPTN